MLLCITAISNTKLNPVCEHIYWYYVLNSLGRMSKISKGIYNTPQSRVRNRTHHALELALEKKEVKVKTTLISE